MGLIHHLHPHPLLKGKLHALLHLERDEEEGEEEESGRKTSRNPDHRVVLVPSGLDRPLTLEEKSGGRVLDPVSLLIKKFFQLVNLCRMAENRERRSISRPGNVAARTALRLLTLRWNQRLPSGGAPAHRVDVRNTQVQPEVPGGVAIEALVTQ